MEEEGKEIFREFIKGHYQVITAVLDTDILIDSSHGFAPWIKTLSHEKEKFLLVIPTIVIAEYLTAEENNLKEYSEKSKEFLQLFKIQDFTTEIAEILGAILRKKTYSHSASTADLIIASTALLLNAELVTRNKKDFAKIPDLTFFDPKKYDLL